MIFTMYIVASLFCHGKSSALVLIVSRVESMFVQSWHLNECRWLQTVENSGSLVLKAYCMQWSSTILSSVILTVQESNSLFYNEFILIYIYTYCIYMSVYICIYILNSFLIILTFNPDLRYVLAFWRDMINIFDSSLGISSLLIIFSSSVNPLEPSITKLSSPSTLFLTTAGHSSNIL